MLTVADKTAGSVIVSELLRIISHAVFAASLILYIIGPRCQSVKQSCTLPSCTAIDGILISPVTACRRGNIYNPVIGTVACYIGWGDSCIQILPAE